MSVTDKSARENFEFLWPTIQGRKEVQLALTICQSNDEQSLDHLLRRHVPGSENIESPIEMEERDALDRTLQSFSLLTIGLIAGYFPGELSADAKDTILKILSSPSVRRYHEDYYPLLLPSLLRLHLTKQQVLDSERGEQAWGAFQWFIRFSGMFESDPNLDIFLQLMDGFQFGELSLKSFLEGLKDPVQALSGIVKPPDRLTRGDRAVLGMMRFLTFCREFAAGLQLMAETPLTRSACWFYYAYWFKEFGGDVGSGIESCLSTMDQWLKADAVGADAAQQGEKTVLETRAAVNRLLTGDDARPLLNWLRSKSNG